MEKQTARIDPILVRDYCRGFEVGFLESDSTTIPTAVTSAPAVDCTLPTGDTLSSNQKTYDKNLFLQSTFSVPDADCDNTMKFVDRASKGLMAAMQKIALGLNNTILARLVANAQTPTYAGDKGTINGNTIEFAAADFATGDAGADLVGYWNEIAIKEYLSSDYYVINGTNFQALNFNAQFRAANDNQRNQALAFGWQNKMAWDLHNLDNVVGSPSSFVIDPNMVFSFRVSVIIVLIAAFGGAATLFGPILGAFIIIPISEIARIFFGGAGRGFDTLIFGILILFVALYRPLGIITLFYSKKT